MKEKLISFTLKKGSIPKQRYIAKRRMLSMREAEIEANALSDKDNPPLTKAELAKFRPVKHVKAIDVKAVRERLGLSQEQFAFYFGVSVRTLQDWEQHRHTPNRTARNFLLVVAKEPRAVQRALLSN